MSMQIWNFVAKLVVEGGQAFDENTGICVLAQGFQCNERVHKFESQFYEEKGKEAWICVLVGYLTYLHIP